jgi:hypothetical protein
MINLKTMLSEDRGSDSVEYGCLMALVPDNYSEIINKFNNMMIPEEDLYKEGDEYGREMETHITILYGFTKELNELDVRRLLKNQNPFWITLTGISKFESKDKPYDVVKYNVESEVLHMLHELAKKMYPNVQTFPEYHPHMTIAYVKKGTFPHDKEGLDIQIPIKQVFYSTANQVKSYYDLGI